MTACWNPTRNVGSHFDPEMVNPDRLESRLTIVVRPQGSDTFRSITLDQREFVVCRPSDGWLSDYGINPSVYLLNPMMDIPILNVADHCRPQVASSVVTRLEALNSASGSVLADQVFALITIGA